MRTRDELVTWRTEQYCATFNCQEPPFEREFLSILYLEPAEPIIDDSPTKASLEGAIRRVRTMLQEDGSAAIPQLFGDLFVCHSKSSVGNRWDLVAIRHSPLENCEPMSHNLPRTLMDLERSVSLVHRLEGSVDVIRQHPQLRLDPSSYVSRLLDFSPTDPFTHRWRTGLKASRAYRQHMANRLRGIDSKDSAVSLAKAYRAAAARFEMNADNTEDNWLWVTDKLSVHPFRYGMVSLIYKELRSAGTAVEEVADELELRDRVIGDYLTDYLNAAVARSNMLLQRVVIRLSIIAIVIAVLSLLIAVLSLLKP